MMAIQISMMNLGILTQIGLETLETIAQSWVLYSSWLVLLSVGAQKNNCQLPCLVLKVSIWPLLMLPRRQFGFSNSYMTYNSLSPILPLSLPTTRVPLPLLPIPPSTLGPSTSVSDTISFGIELKNEMFFLSMSLWVTRLQMS